ncbi:MAG: exodeoxyribonuclease VII small subunit [bacterium]
MSDDSTTSLEESHDFQSALDRIRSIAKDLEEGDLALEDAMERYEEGLELIQFCENRLQDAELLIEEVDDSNPESPEISPKDD